MAEIPEVTTSSPIELLGIGRRHLAVKDYSAAAGALAKACELLASEHGDTADQCAEAYLWYGKALLGLSREESVVLGDGVAGTTNAEEDDDDDNEDQEENGENGEAEAEKENGETKVEKENDENEVAEAENEVESTTKDEEPGSSTVKDGDTEKPGPSNGDANEESSVDMETEDEVDNLQLAWEMLDLARSILNKRYESGGGQATRALLADVHLALGEVALESETYDKAVIDMQSCLEIQKELYHSDDRRIAETHYQIGLANSLASNFDDAVTHFKNTANILESRIKILENPTAATDDASVKKFSSADPFYSIEGEIKELKELLPEIQEKIQDMMEYKAETLKRVRETLCANGEGSSQSNGSSSSTTDPKPVASDISHLVKRKRKASDGDAGTSAAKKTNTVN